MQKTQSGQTLRVITSSPDETQALGQNLGRLAKAGDVFLLTGGLGAGKTCLTQGIASGLKVASQVRSPTFVFVTQHRGRIPLYHVDLYRIKSGDDTLDLGLEEYFHREGLTVVEWADRAPEAAPPQHLSINFTVLSETARSIELEPHGARYTKLVEELKSL